VKQLIGNIADDGQRHRLDAAATVQFNGDARSRRFDQRFSASSWQPAQRAAMFVLPRNE